MIGFIKCFTAVLLMAVIQRTASAQTQDVNTIYHKLLQKVEMVKDYTADIKMNINVSFMRVPQLNGKLYYKYPDKVKIERNGGISILPKSTISLMLSNLIPNSNSNVIDAGYEMVDGINARIIKIIPNSEQSDIILTKLWIDEVRVLALRTETTTRESGTIRMDMYYNKYAAYGLPDRATFYIDVKDYKLPKGVTMDYDTDDAATRQKVAAAPKNKKGRVQITYLDYQINPGLPDNIFVEKRK